MAQSLLLFCSGDEQEAKAINRMAVE